MKMQPAHLRNAIYKQDLKYVQCEGKKKNPFYAIVLKVLLSGLKRKELIYIYTEN